MLFTDDQRRLLTDLLHAYRINLEGHVEAIKNLPDLILVADQGYTEAEAQLRLVDLTLETLFMDGVE